MPIKEHALSKRSLTLEETRILMQFREWILTQQQIINPNIGEYLRVQSVGNSSLSCPPFTKQTAAT